MKEYKIAHFFKKTKKYPIKGQIELSYNCALDCIHCYCKDSGKAMSCELNTSEWKRVLDEIHEAGCLFLVFTGGDPLIRKDFLEIYSYARAKGFLVAIFTSGQLFTKEIVDYLTRFPPFSIEITLNGITGNTYEAITQTNGSFTKVVSVIKVLKEKNLRLVLKANCFKQNKNEIAKIKKWAEDILGRPSKNTHYFKYDPMVYPRLNGDRSPCGYRLSFEEIKEARMRDPDIWEEYKRGVNADFPDLSRDRKFLYQCSSWMNQFFINPYGKLKFCQFSEKFSVDLKTVPFEEGFYRVFAGVLGEQFKTDSKCRDCELRPICYHCPARAYLETGDEEAPVPYYCALAEETMREKEVVKA